MKIAKNKKQLVIILGPTSAGKTSLAVKLAREFNGEIVSADSRQVYKGLNIGTGKDLKEYKLQETRNTRFAREARREKQSKIPYHLIDVADPSQQFTLAKYQKMAYQAIEKIISKNKLPFLVGGTGLYISAITKGYQLNKIKPDQNFRSIYESKNLTELKTLAEKHNLILNNSDLNNKRRLIRYLEIAHLRGKRYENRPKYECLKIGLKYPSAILNQKIDERLKFRLEKEGLINEVQNLLNQGLSFERLHELGLEYRYVSKYLKNDITYDELFNLLSIAIHQFAKRQMTWFKGEADIIWTNDYKTIKQLIKKFLDFSGN